MSLYDNEFVNLERNTNQIIVAVIQNNQDIINDVP